MDETTESGESMGKYIGHVCLFGGKNVEDLGILGYITSDGMFAKYDMQGHYIGMNRFCRPHPQTVELLSLRNTIVEIRDGLRSLIKDNNKSAENPGQ